jgi:monoamine oxidase
MFEAKASDAFTGDYRLTNWGSKPYTVGTWVEGFNVKKSTLKELNRPLNHRVYFAGEANDPYQQLGVPAAVLSGLHTVDRLLSDAAITRRR